MTRCLSLWQNLGLINDDIQKSWQFGLSGIFKKLSAFFESLSGFFWRCQKVILSGFLYILPPNWIRKKNHAINCFSTGITHHIQQMKLSDLNELKSLKALFCPPMICYFKYFLAYNLNYNFRWSKGITILKTSVEYAIQSFQYKSETISFEFVGSRSLNEISHICFHEMA